MKNCRKSRIPGWVALFIGLVASLSVEPSPAISSPIATGAQAKGASVSGVLLAQDNAPQGKTEVRLVKVRLVSLLGREISSLPPTETVIIDSNGKAVAVAETDAAGKFDFTDVQAGRYALAVASKTGGVAGQRWLEDIPGRTKFFDVAGTGKVELGRLKAASK